MDDGIFWHKCEDKECDVVVEFDDEPYCFVHSPDSGSSVRGYSARREALSRENLPDGVTRDGYGNEL